MILGFFSQNVVSFIYMLQMALRHHRLSSFFGQAISAGQSRGLTSCSAWVSYQLRMWLFAYRVRLSLTLHLQRRSQLPRSRQPRRSRRSPQRSELALYHSFCFVLCGGSYQLCPHSEISCKILPQLSHVGSRKFCFLPLIVTA